MASGHWDHETDPNIELWDELFWRVAQWICQQRPRREAGPPDNHIDNPAVDNDPCDWCYDQGRDLMHSGLHDLLEVYGSLAYACGRESVPEHEAVRRALQGMIERAREIEGATQLLADVGGKDGWSRLALEQDERRLLLDDEPLDDEDED